MKVYSMVKGHLY